MKIEKLTDNKIRIIINIEELIDKNISIDNITKNREKIHTFLDDMLKEAEKQVGFKVNNCRLLIEAFSTSEDVVVFTFTKCNKVEKKKNPKQIRFTRKKNSLDYKNAIYKFNSFEEYCNFCTYCYNSKLSDLKQLSKNIALYEYNDAYFLILTSINKEYQYLSLFYNSISEFSNLASTSLAFKSKIQEYGKAVFKANAVKNAIKYFTKN